MRRDEGIRGASSAIGVRNVRQKTSLGRQGEAEFDGMRQRLGSALRDWRTSRGLAGDDVAGLLGLDRAGYYKSEAGHPKIRVDFIMRILLILGVNRRVIGAAIAGGNDDARTSEEKPNGSAGEAGNGAGEG